MPTKLRIKRIDNADLESGYGDLQDGELLVTRNIELTGPQDGIEVLDRTLLIGDGNAFGPMPVSGAGGGNVTDSLLMTSAMFGATPNVNKQFSVSGRTTIYNRFAYLPSLYPMGPGAVDYFMGSQCKAIINGTYQVSTPFVITDVVGVRTTNKSTIQYALVFADFNIDRTGSDELGSYGSSAFSSNVPARGRLLNPLVNYADIPTNEAEIDALVANWNPLYGTNASPYVDNLIYAGVIQIPADYDVNNANPALNPDQWDWDADSTSCVFTPLWDLYAPGTDFGRWGRVQPNLSSSSMYDFATPQITDRPYITITLGDYHTDSNFAFPDNRYMVILNTVSYEGSEMQLGSVTIEDKTVNGFKINTNGWVDKLVVDWYAVYVGR